MGVMRDELTESSHPLRIEIYEQSRFKLEVLRGEMLNFVTGMQDLGLRSVPPRPKA